LKIKNQITKNLGAKTQPDSAFQLSVTTIEEQGILERFSRLPQAEREIVRELLDKLHDGLTFAPVLVEDLNAVFRLDCIHGFVLC
jgi:hypothetical protein